MHVGIVSPWGTQGGLSGYTSNLATALSRKPEVKVSVLPWNPGSGPVRKAFAGPQFLFNYLQKTDLDVIHIQFVMGDYLPTYLPLVGALKKIVDAKLVVTFHEHYNYPFVPIRRTLQEYRNQVVRVIDEAIVHSDSELSWLPPKAREIASVVPHGVEPKENTLDTQKRIFLPGFISDKKDCKTAIHAMKRVAEEYPEHNLLIAGKFETDAYYEELCQIVDGLGVSEHVTVLNEYIPDEEYISLFKSSKIVLIPQVHSASSSGTLSDVLAYQIPAIITSAPVLKEYTQYEAKYYKFGDVDALSQTVLDLLGNPQQRQSMKESFRRIAAENDWEQIADLHYDIYKK
ncbi:glycosyltransferase [Haloferax volcanii]|uniref:glycosyltransferase n=1 Tax=Haloferax volcanii TaxID=2246 RepID=UPI00385DB23C